jgi:glycosyltransferase involved in cell wall biosynthesis
MREMRVCFSCVEFFAWGKYGGFGRASRKVCRELIRRGIEVFAVVPRQRGQKEFENIDGVRVISFPKHMPWKVFSIYKNIDADIYHASEPSLSTYFAVKAMPHKKHIIHFQDARNFTDWKIEFAKPSLNKLQVVANYIYEHNFLVTRAVRKAHGVFSQSESQINKIKIMYHLNQVLPLHNPVDIPHQQLQKAKNPTVGWMNRWDRRKRPELFLELSAKFPEVRFIAAGESRDKGWDRFLRNKYRHNPNLELVGHVDQFENPETHSKILEECWIMVNTATREALPTNSFIESAAHKCALLAGLDYRDGFAENFGYCAIDGDFEKGLRWLLEGNRWRELGEKGYAHVSAEYRTELVIDRYIQIYDAVLSGKQPGIYFES